MKEYNAIKYALLSTNDCVIVDEKLMNVFK